MDRLARQVVGLPTEVQRRIYTDVPAAQRYALGVSTRIPLSAQAILDSIEYDTLLDYVEIELSSRIVPVDLEAYGRYLSDKKLVGSVTINSRANIHFTLSLSPYELKVIFTTTDAVFYIYFYQTLAGKAYVTLRHDTAAEHISVFQVMYQVAAHEYISIQASNIHIGMTMLHVAITHSGAFQLPVWCDAPTMYVAVAHVGGVARKVYLDHIEDVLAWCHTWLSLDYLPVYISTKLTLFLSSKCFIHTVLNPPYPARLPWFSTS